ncbi:MAG: hypothetical protein ACR2KO_02760, partial [Geodermatophilaceae bacterium]
RTVVSYAYYEEVLDDAFGQFGAGRRLLESHAPGARSTAVIRSMVFGGLAVLCAILVLRGSCWAAALGVALCALTLVTTLVTLRHRPAGILTIFIVLQQLVAATVIVLLIARPARSFFRAART